MEAKSEGTNRESAAVAKKSLFEISCQFPSVSKRTPAFCVSNKSVIQSYPVQMAHIGQIRFHRTIFMQKSIDYIDDNDENVYLFFFMTNQVFLLKVEIFE